VLAVLRELPEVARALELRGIELRPLPGEVQEALENRIATGLMALYRDTRSEAAFEALYSATEPGVLQWIKNLAARCGAKLDPVEILQDTFVNVFRYPTGFCDRHTGSYRVWVRTIAGNLVRRSRARSARLALQSLPDGSNEPVDPRESPDSSAQAGEQELSLRTAWMIFLHHYGEAWKALRPRDKLALHLVEVEGRSYTEAGTLLRVGRSNMKMIVFRSRKRMARRMAESMRANPGLGASLASEHARPNRVA
jgi:DNA-directed RNA polymerase specialized sigma24 family protein